jgi:hypothetical protein
MAATPWATLADVTAVTGKTVDAPTLALAISSIELVTGLIAEVERVDMTRRDAYWLRQAVAFQAAWIADTPDYLERNAVASASADGQSATGEHADWLVIAPLARRALKRLSWRGTRTIRPVPVDANGRVRVPSYYVPLEAHDDLTTPWRQL